MEEYTLRVFENRMARKIFGPTWEELTEDRNKLRMRSFVNYVHHQIILKRPKEEERDSGTCGTYRKDNRCIQVFDGDI
jgi:hypothetical protein